MMNTKSDLNFILPATEPVIRAGVITANIIWKQQKTIFGIVALSVYPFLSETPSRPSQLKFPIIPLSVGAKESEYPNKTHITIPVPIIKIDVIIVFTAFFFLTSPP